MADLRILTDCIANEPVDVALKPIGYLLGIKSVVVPDCPEAVFGRLSQNDFHASAERHR